MTLEQVGAVLYFVKTIGSLGILSLELSEVGNYHSEVLVIVCSGLLTVVRQPWDLHSGH